MLNGDDIPELEKPESGLGFDPTLGMESVEVNRNSKNKITAGILAVLFGAWGAHKFYLGYFKTGIIMALTTIILLPAGIVFLTALIGACEGVHYLMMDRERFYLQYVAHKKYWF